MAATTQKLAIERGKTFSQVVRWEVQPFLFAAISAMAQAAPAGVTTTGAHGIPDGWRVAVVGAKGNTGLNAENNPPKGKDFRPATVLSATGIEFNEFNSTGFPAYTGGGYLQWYTPQDLTDYIARLTIKDRVGGTVLLALTSAAGDIVIDNTAKTITITISATDTADFTWSKGVYDLEMESDTGVVTALMAGTVSVSTEVTT